MPSLAQVMQRSVSPGCFGRLMDPPPNMACKKLVHRYLPRPPRSPHLRQERSLVSVIRPTLSSFPSSRKIGVTHMCLASCGAQPRVLSSDNTDFVIRRVREGTTPLASLLRSKVSTGGVFPRCWRYVIRGARRQRSMGALGCTARDVLENVDKVMLRCGRDRIGKKTDIHQVFVVKNHASTQRHVSP